MSAIWLPKHNLKNDNTSCHVNVAEEIYIWLLAYRNYRKSMGEGNSVFSRDEPPDRLPNPKRSALNTCESNTKVSQHIVDMCTYVYICV